jgi:hypothetical protein
VPYIHLHWLEYQPSKNEFRWFLQESFSEGLDSIQVVERWSKNSEFLPYVNSLEEWDEIVGGKWVVQDSHYLNPSLWLNSGNFAKNEQYLKRIFEVFDLGNKINKLIILLKKN